MGILDIDKTQIGLGLVCVFYIGFESLFSIFCNAMHL